MPQGAPSQPIGYWHSLSGPNSDSGCASSRHEEIDALLRSGEASVFKEVINPQRPGPADEQADIHTVSASREPVEGEAGRRPPMNAALLNVYDLNEDVSMANKLLAFSSDHVALGGLFHTGVEVFGSEWSFGSLGVHALPPRTCSRHVYRCSVDLGLVKLSRSEIASVIWKMCQEWRGNDYRLLGHNCCDFAAELCIRLKVREMPGWVDRFARLLRPGHQATEQVMNAFEAMRQTASKAFGHAALSDDVGDDAQKEAASETKLAATLDLGLESGCGRDATKNDGKSRRVYMRWPTQPRATVGGSNTLLENFAIQVAGQLRKQERGAETTSDSPEGGGNVFMVRYRLLSRSPSEMSIVQPTRRQCASPPCASPGSSSPAPGALGSSGAAQAPQVSQPGSPGSPEPAHTAPAPSGTTIAAEPSEATGVAAETSAGTDSQAAADSRGMTRPLEAEASTNAPPSTGVAARPETSGA